MDRVTGTNAVPNPGSDEAIAKGCTCPIMDNAHGIGYRGIPGQWVYTCGCPVHAPGDARPLPSQEATHG